jgi:DNA-binding transcriptional ArsR family regulator
MPTSRIRRDAYKDVFGALAHPARRGVLLAVYFNGGAMTAGDIAAMFAHAWQTTTRHLQVLEAAGLLTHERQGRMRIYRIERKRLALVGDWLAHFQVPVRQRAGGKQDVRNKKTTAVKTKPPKREAPDDVPQFFRSTSRSAISTRRPRSIPSCLVYKGASSRDTDATSIVGR